MQVALRLLVPALLTARLKPAHATKVAVMAEHAAPAVVNNSI